MSKLPLRKPVNASALPSGDHPCQYDGPSGVICRGDPRLSAPHTRANCVGFRRVAEGQFVPSGEMPWSLLH